MSSRANSCPSFAVKSASSVSANKNLSFFFPFFFAIFSINRSLFLFEENLSSFCRAFCGASVLLELSRILHKHTRTKNNLIITNMSAALTSSTFVGAKVSVAKTTTASKRVAFSVQANASGPKKVRIPISFFFVRLKNHHRRSFQAGGGASKFCISSNEKVRLRTIFLRNVDEAVVCEFWKRSMRVYSDAKVHFERNYALF